MAQPRRGKRSGDSRDEAGAMRAILRWRTMLLAGGLWLLPVSAVAQNTTEPPATTTPAPDTVGPRELNNFRLPGTATRPGEQPPAAPGATVPAQSQPAEVSRATPVPARRTVQTRRPARGPAAPARPPVTQLPAVSSPVVPPPTPPTVTLRPAPTATIPQDSAAQPAALPPEPKPSILPWLIAALALAAGTIFLLWRRRPREAYAGPQIDLFVPPEPAAVSPAPRPIPVPPKPAPPVSSGIVAARLRPSLEIGVQPLRCLIEDERVTIEFELDLYNAGTAPARAVLAEASLLNPGATQEQDLAAFFASPVGAGQRLDAIPPMKRITLTSQVVAPRASIQEYELGGRKAFVPVIAFNALYEWSGGKAQTSAAYLVGRETRGDKLGPLRLSPVAREFRGLAAHLLPTALRT
jgi:hypothetical protein